MTSALGRGKRHAALPLLKLRRWNDEVELERRLIELRKSSDGRRRHSPQFTAHLVRLIDTVKANRPRTALPKIYAIVAERFDLTEEQVRGIHARARRAKVKHAS